MSQQHGNDRQPIPPTQVLPAHQRPAQPPAPVPGHADRQYLDGRYGGPYEDEARRPEPRYSAPQHPDSGAVPAAEPDRPGRRGTEPTAVASLVSGILGIVLPLVGVLAIVLGGVGLDRMRRRGTSGRGMAVTGVTLGCIQVVITAIVVVGAWAAWNAFGEDIERGIAQANELAETDLSFTDLFGGVTDGVSFGDLGELADSLGRVDELQGSAEQCRSGDAASCEDLLESVPEGLLPQELKDLLPEKG